MMQRRLFGIPMPIVLILGLIGVVVVILLVATLINSAQDILEFIFYADDRVDNVIECADSSGCQVVQPLLYTAILLAITVTGFAYTTLLERKLIAWLQQRVGPNRVGPGGFLQPAADGVKLIFKENIQPAGANIWVYRIAPILKVMPTLVVLGVIPFGPKIIMPWFDGNFYRIPLGLIDPDVGILWILAITSIGTYGVALAGWSSNNKYSMLGAIRASAQMVSYELSMGLALAVPVMIAGTMSMGGITESQGGLLINWFIFQNPLAAFILLVALIAETNRAPFDLPEAEQELTAGYMTEYSGMKFALFMMAEYLGMIAVSAIWVTAFLGGYQDGFGLVDKMPILGPLVMIGKIVLMLVFFIWVRATLPRIRYDRLMSFGWKIMLPLAIVAVAWTAIAVVVGEELGQSGYMIFTTVTIAILVLVLGVLVLRSEDETAEDDDYDLDPMITGEQGGIAYGILMLVGGLLAIPFTLFESTIKILEGLASLGRDPEPEAPAESDDSTALPSEASGD